MALEYSSARSDHFGILASLLEVHGVDTPVTALGHQAVDALQLALEGWDGEVHLIGDGLAPRSAEEAVLDGLRAGSAV